MWTRYRQGQGYLAADSRNLRFSRLSFVAGRGIRCPSKRAGVQSWPKLEKSGVVEPARCSPGPRTRFVSIFKGQANKPNHGHDSYTSRSPAPSSPRPPSVPPCISTPRLRLPKHLHFPWNPHARIRALRSQPALTSRLTRFNLHVSVRREPVRTSSLT